MADPESTIEAIRAILAVGGRVSEEQLTEPAANYGQFCKELNQRLRRCDEYARRQLFSELLYLSQCTTNLEAAIQLAAAIDQNQWATLCAGRGLELPPKVQEDLWPAIAVALEKAQKIEPLIARYRLLVLAKSPALERLKLLRPIAAEATSSVWEEQVRRVEEIRLTEMNARGKAALKARDVAQIGSLLKEIEAPGWRASAHGNVLAFLRKARFQLRQENAAAEFRKLLPQLQSAFDAKDFARCETLYSQVQRLLETGFSVNQEAVHRVRNIQRWVDQQQRLRTSTKKIEAIQPILDDEHNRRGRKKRIGVILAGGTLLTVVTGILAAVYRKLHGSW